jgi:hypothetical protein
MTPGAVGALAAISRHVGSFHAVSAYVYFLFGEKLTPFVWCVKLCKFEACFCLVALFCPDQTLLIPMALILGFCPFPAKSPRNCGFLLVGRLCFRFVLTICFSCVIALQYALFKHFGNSFCCLIIRLRSSSVAVCPAGLSGLDFLLRPGF